MLNKTTKTTKCQVERSTSWLSNVAMVGKTFLLLMLSKKHRPFFFVFKMEQVSFESFPYITWQKLGLCSLVIF